MMDPIVNFKIASRLRECGFNERTYLHYLADENNEYLIRDCSFNIFNDDVKDIQAPTLSHVQQWLRSKGIIVSVDYVSKGRYKLRVYYPDKDGNEQYIQIDKVPYVWAFEDYNFALETGINKALEYL